MFFSFDNMIPKDFSEFVQCFLVFRLSTAYAHPWFLFGSSSPIHCFYNVLCFTNRGIVELRVQIFSFIIFQLFF